MARVEIDTNSASDLLVAAAPSPALRAILLEVRLEAIERFLRLPQDGARPALLVAQDLVRELSHTRSPLLPAIFGQSQLLNPYSPDSYASALSAILIGLSQSADTLPSRPLEQRLHGTVFTDPLRRVAVVVSRLRRCILDSSGLHLEYESQSGGIRRLLFVPGRRAPAGPADGAEIVPFERASQHGVKPYLAWAPAGLPYPLGAAANDPDGRIRAALRRGHQLLTRWEPAWAAWYSSCERLDILGSGVTEQIEDRSGIISIQPSLDGVEVGERLLRSERSGLIQSIVGAERAPLAQLAAQASVVNFLDWLVRIEDPQLNQDEVVTRRAQARAHLSELWDGYESTKPANEPLRSAISDVVRTYSPIDECAAPPSGGRRLLLVNLDFRDFAFSYFWGRAMSEEAQRQGYTVDALTVHPFANRDLAAELGLPRSALDDKSGANTAYLDSEDLHSAKKALASLTKGKQYDTLVIHCDAAFLEHLLLEQGDSFASSRWLIYASQLHDDLGSNSDKVKLVDRTKQLNVHLFARQELALSGQIDRSNIARNFRGEMERVGFPENRTHLCLCPVDETFFGVAAANQPHSSPITIFCGGDSELDYRTLFAAVEGLSVRVRVATSMSEIAIPSNVEILPRLRLHEFRNEMARADLVVVPLSGEAQVAGVTVVATARMLGQPVIATDMPVTRLHVTSPGEDGLLVPRENADALRAAIQRLLSNPSQRVELGKAARVGATRDLTPTSLVRRMLECDARTPYGPRIRLAAATPQGDVIDRSVELWPSREIADALDPIVKEFARNEAGGAYVFAPDTISPRIGEIASHFSSSGGHRPAFIASFDAGVSAVRALATSNIRQIYFTIDGASNRTVTQAIKRVADLSSQSGRRDGAGPWVGIHLTLVEERVEELPAIIRELAAEKIRELLVWESPSPLDPEETLRTIDAAWAQCAEAGIHLRIVGFKSLRHASFPIHGPVPLAHVSLLDLLRQEVRPPSTASGVRIAGARTAERIVAAAQELASHGCPVVDLPPCLGGVPPELAPRRDSGIKSPACRTCPVDPRCTGLSPELAQLAGIKESLRPPPHWLPLRADARVLVALAGSSQSVERDSSLPGLAYSLATLGAKVDLVALHAERARFRYTERNANLSFTSGPHSIESLMDSANPYDLVVTPDVTTGRRLIASKRLPPETRLAVTDFHMLGGMDEWIREWLPASQRAEDGGWWPCPQAVLQSGFPGYVHLYRNYGIPLNQVAWQPYALNEREFRFGPPVSQCRYIMSGGGHLRDLGTLSEAGRQLEGRSHPIRVYSNETIPDRGVIEFKGGVELVEYVAAIANSRFVVAPVHEDINKAAGVSAFTMAIATGRPVIATATTAARDYIEDGVNGILVPAGDAYALAEAIARLDSDDRHLESLAAGAREAAQWISTERWARELLYGSSIHRPDHWMWKRLARAQAGRR